MKNRPPITRVIISFYLLGRYGKITITTSLVFLVYLGVVSLIFKVASSYHMQTQIPFRPQTLMVLHVSISRTHVTSR
jgi:hypothetical protein